MLVNKFNTQSIKQLEAQKEQAKKQLKEKQNGGHKRNVSI